MLDTAIQYVVSLIANHPVAAGMIGVSFMIFVNNRTLFTNLWNKLPKPGPGPRIENKEIKDTLDNLRIQACFKSPVERDRINKLIDSLEEVWLKKEYDA